MNNADIYHKQMGEFFARKFAEENRVLRRDVQLKDEALRKKSRTIGALRKAKREADAQLRMQLTTIERLARQVIQLQTNGGRLG